jgi:hypothetical protein
MTIGLASEEIHFRKGDGKVVPGTSGKQQKDWMTANFRVEIGGLPCERVSKVELPKFTLKITEHRGGSRRTAQRHPASVELSDINLTISAADWEAWRDAADTVMTKGQMTPSTEMTGSITFLSPDLGTELGRLELDGLHIHKLGIGAAESGPEANGGARFTVELTVNRCAFTFQEA